MRKTMLLAGVASLVCATAQADWTVTENVQLTADMMGQGVVTFGADATIDLNGFKLEASSFIGSGAITDRSSGTPGELHINVPANTTTLDSVKLDGNFKLVKDGAGTLVIDKNQTFRNENRQYTYSGGTDIVGGSVMLPVGTYPGHDGGCFFGASPQTITVYQNGTLDMNGAYDYNGPNVVLAGGTIANNGPDTDNIAWGGNAAHSLSASSFCDVAANYLWHGFCEFNGNTLTVNISDGKRFYLKSNSIQNGRLFVPDNGGSNAGILDVLENNTSANVDADLYCVAELQGNFNLRNFTYRANGADANNRSGVAYVSGVFTPLSDYFPNVSIQNGATIDLNGRDGAWNLESLDGHRCTFPDGAAVTLDVTGRTLDIGDIVLAWTTPPTNIGQLSFAFKNDATTAVLTPEGIVYGADPDSTDVAKATWTGNEGDGDVSKPGNWTCENAAGVVLAGGYLPEAMSTIYISGNTRINVPLDSDLTCTTIALGDCTLAANCDWSGLAKFTALLQTATIDVGEHTLTLGGFSGLGKITGTAGGTLRVNVPSGATAENKGTAITGELELVKVGEGSFVATASKLTYTGGTTVENGTLKAGTGDAHRPFGADGSQITVAQGATFDADGRGFFGVYRFVSNGGTLVLPAAASVSAANFTFNEIARKVADNEILLTENRNDNRGTAWLHDSVDPSVPWRATFTYINKNDGNPADGVSFVFQSDGPKALGGGGGGIGLDGISSAVGCAYGIYGDDTLGWVVDGNRNYPCAIEKDFGIKIQDGIDVVIEYDGNGTLVQTVSQLQDGTTKSVTITNEVDFSAKFGGTAYVGFTGACGGAWCEQRIRNFSFMQFSAQQQLQTGGVNPVPFDLPVNGDDWQYNGDNCDPKQVELNGQPAILLTDNYSQRAAAIFKTKIDATHPFAISGTYFAQNDGTIPFADGAGFIFHNDALTTVGTGGTGAEGFATSCGWTFVIFEGDRVRFMKNGDREGSDCPLSGSGVSFSARKPIDFTISYNYGMLRLDLAQENDDGVSRFSASHPVNLAEVVGADTMYFALTGGTGGYYAEQYVYDLSYRPLESDLTGGMGVEYVSVTDGTTIVCPAPGPASIAHLTLVDNAAVTVMSADAADVGYELQVGEFLFAAQGADFPTRPALVCAASGTLGVGGFTQTAANLGSFVTVTADALSAFNGGSATINLPDFTGSVSVLDQCAVPEAGRLAAEDFTIVSPARAPKETRSVNGKIFAFRSTGTIILIR